MTVTDKAPRKLIESWSPAAFLVAGIILLGYAGIKGGEVLMGTSAPDVLKVTIGHIGLLVPVLGLLGLYSRSRDSAPKLSIAGVVTSVLSAVCSIVLLVSLAHLTLTMEGYPAIPEDVGQGLLPALWGPIILLASILTLLLGFLFLGVASLRTDVVSRPISYLLLVPGVMWVALFLMHAAGLNGTVIGIVVYVPIGVSLLAIGFGLRNTPVPADQGQPSTDPTV